MERSTWILTLATQIFLCFALFVALNIGRSPQKPIYGSYRSDRNPIDVYFLSVTGGFRPLKEQNHLLKLMEKVIKKYNARFVVNLSELGEDDPLLQNSHDFTSNKANTPRVLVDEVSLAWGLGGSMRKFVALAKLYFTGFNLWQDLTDLLQQATLYLQLRKVPWYTTKALKGNEVNYFVRRLEIPSSKVLDVIVLHTGSLQDSSSGNENDRLHWLTKPLQGSNSDWRIVVGFHPLVGCVENLEKMDLHHIFLKYGVIYAIMPDSEFLANRLLKIASSLQNAYLSAQSSTKYVQAEDIAHIYNKSAMDRGPYFTSINEKRILHSDIVNGFLLHRVSSLEIVTYSVTLTGEVVHQTSLQQGGREVM